MSEIKLALEAPQAVAKFTKLVSAVNRMDAEKAGNIYQLEQFHFLKELQEKSLQDVSQISAVGVFLDVVSNGLSFASGAKHVYLMKRKVKVGDNWEDRLVWSATPDGKIFQCQRSGAIDHVTKPVMVYEGDEIGIGNKDGFQFVEHKAKIPRAKDAALIGGYVYTVYKNGQREAFWMDMNDVARLKGYSETNNSKYDKETKTRVKGQANSLYSSGPGGTIDTGFFGAKLISHALKNIRKNAIASVHEVDADEADYEFTEAHEVKPEQPQIMEAKREPTIQNQPDPKPESSLFDNDLF